jgi:hypothetical protein
MADALPEPYALTPNPDFIGNDGNWSTFTFNAGDDGHGNTGQDFKLLISTSSPFVLLPGQAGWCNDDCASSRGIMLYRGQQSLGYDLESSSAGKRVGLYSVPAEHRPWASSDLRGNLNEDNIGIGPTSTTSPTLAQQYLVEYKFEEYYLGSFGLAVGAVNVAGATRTPFLRNFYSTADIKTPSLSYGYTPGAFYRESTNGLAPYKLCSRR